jgi:hypothetical protein
MKATDKVISSQHGGVGVVDQVAHDDRGGAEPIDVARHGARHDVGHQPVDRGARRASAAARAGRTKRVSGLLMLIAELAQPQPELTDDEQDGQD